MAVPHQALPVVAGIDILSASLFAVQLAFTPFSDWLGRSRMPLTGHGTSSTVSKVAAAAASATARGGASAWLQNVLGSKQGMASHADQAYHSITVNIAQSASLSKASVKLLLTIALTCLVRCSIVLLISRSVASGIRQRRAGGSPQSWSDTAVFCSIACVASILINLFMLNSVFQSRGLTRKGSADASVFGILGKLDIGSFAAEQLIISFIEWILFVGIVATNKELAMGPQTQSRPTQQKVQSSSRITSSAPSGYEIRDSAPQRDVADNKVDVSSKKDVAIDAQTQPKDYGSIKHAFPSSDASSSAGAASADAKAAQGESRAKDVPSVPVTSTKHGVASLTAPEPGHAKAFQGNSSAASYAERASAETSTIDGTLDSSAPPRASLAADGSTAGDASDIVDMPRDRKVSMQAARERLQRARDNGKVRRRSIWKKIRGKNGETASMMGVDDSAMS